MTVIIFTKNVVVNMKNLPFLINKATRRIGTASANFDIVINTGGKLSQNTHGRCGSISNHKCQTAKLRLLELNGQNMFFICRLVDHAACLARIQVSFCAHVMLTLPIKI